jgi:TRAP-type C4-dicarboxylate transport system permease small subunit
MRRLVHIIEKWSDYLARTSAVLLGLMTLLILVEIFLWNAFEVSTLIADEYSAYGMAAIVFLAAGYTLKENGHIRITLILNFLPSKVSRVVTALATSVTTIFMAYVFWYLYKMTASTLRYGSTSGTLTETPLWIPQSVMLVGAASFLLQLFATSIRCFWQVAGEETSHRRLPKDPGEV